MTSRVLTVREAAAELRCGKDNIYALIASGRLRAIRIGVSPRSPYRIPRDALEEFMTRTEVERS